MNTAVGKMSADAYRDQAHGKRSHGLEIMQLLMRADQAQAGRTNHYTAKNIARHVGQFKKFADPSAGEAGEDDNTHNEKRAQMLAMRN